MATPTSQLLSRTLYDTDGITTVWDFSFSGGYLDPAHVRAYIENPLGVRTDIVVTEGMLIGEFQLQITPALAAGNKLIIYRDTPKDLPLVDFTDEAGFSEVALDTNAKQAVFIAAEAIDTVNATDVSAAIDAAVLAVAAQLAAEGSAVAALASQVAAAASALAALTSENAAELAEANAAATLADALAIYGSIAAVNAAAAAASASATAADASEAQAGVFAANALASQNAAAASASAASTSAGTATTQAGIATTQAGIATTQAAAALASANAADVSEAAAAASEAAAAASAASADASLAAVVSTVANFTGRNKIINGKMDVAQRGSVFAAVANASYTLDRWVHFKVSTGIGTVSQSTSAPSDEFQNSLLYNCTTADASVAAGDYTFLRQNIEGYNARDLLGRTFTLSFWVRSRKTGVHCVALGNSGSDRTYIAEYTVLTANTWEKKTITVTGGLIIAGTWNWTTGLGLSLTFPLMAGTTFQTTANSWQTGNFLATVNQVNLLDATGDAIRITGVQLEVGTVASPFEHRFYGQELALCQRYYETGAAGFCSRSGDNLRVGFVQLKVPKRVAPSITTSPSQSIASIYTDAFRASSAGVASDSSEFTFTAASEL